MLDIVKCTAYERAGVKIVRVSTQLKGTWWQSRWATIVGSLANQLASQSQSSHSQTLAVQLSHGTARSLLIPLASWPSVSCGYVRMLAVLLVFLSVATVPAMARDLCQGGECKCNGVVASCSGQDIKVSIRLFI